MLNTTLTRDTRRRTLTLALLSTSVATLLAGCRPAEEAPEEPPAPAALILPEGAEEAAETIAAARLEEHVRRLSADELEGRSPGTEGDRMARRYIVEQLQAAGLEPGGADGGWEQPFEIVGITAEVPDSWSFRAEGGSLALARWDQFIAASGVQQETATLEEAEVVFVGYGIVAPEYGWDDYGDSDLEGKVLVMLNNDPDWSPELFAGERRLYYGRWTYKYESAAARGAAGAIIVHTDESAGYPWQVVQSSWSGEQFELPAGDEPRLQVAAWATREATAQLFELAGHDLAALEESARSPGFSPVPLGLTTSLQLDNRIARGVETANVLGLLRGRDPELAAEVVIHTAHHDHLGRGEPNAAGDAIYNGARDNAAGVAQLLVIAEAMASLPEAPRRSTLFAVVAAEEQGLLGSKYFATHPTFPPGKIAANVNLDAANIFGRTRDLIFVGYGKSSLDAVVEAAADRQDRVVVGDQFPDRGYFYRSDQFSLAKIGVPAVFLDGGTDFRDPEVGPEVIEEWEQVHYHQPSDELDGSWRWDGMVEDTEVAYYAGLAVAEADEMPRWNPGDEFEAVRLAALAAAGE